MMKLSAFCLLALSLAGPSIVVLAQDDCAQQETALRACAAGQGITDTDPCVDCLKASVGGAIGVAFDSCTELETNICGAATQCDSCGGTACDTEIQDLLSCEVNSERDEAACDSVSCSQAAPPTDNTGDTDGDSPDPDSPWDGFCFVDSDPDGSKDNYCVAVDCDVDVDFVDGDLEAKTTCTGCTSSLETPGSLCLTYSCVDKSGYDCQCDSATWNGNACGSCSIYPNVAIDCGNVENDAEGNPVDVAGPTDARGIDLDVDVDCDYVNGDLQCTETPNDSDVPDPENPWDGFCFVDSDPDGSKDNYCVSVNCDTDLDWVNGDAEFRSTCTGCTSSLETPGSLCLTYSCVDMDGYDCQCDSATWNGAACGSCSVYPEVKIDCGNVENDGQGNPLDFAGPTEARGVDVDVDSDCEWVDDNLECNTVTSANDSGSPSPPMFLVSPIVALAAIAFLLL